MPYVITTKRPEQNEGGRGGVVRPPHFSRRAVATLEEARQRIVFALAHGEHMSEDARMAGWIGAEKRITENGGTVGPLPDGTVIEVERVGYRYLLDGLLVAPGTNERSWAEILDAYNARQA